MNPEKSNYVDFLLFVCLTLVFGGITIAAWQSQQSGYIAISGGITLLFVWMLIGDLRKGLRSPTRWEWFKIWMNVRPVLVTGSGLLVIALLMASGDQIFTLLPRQVCAPLLLGGVLVWVLLIFVSIWRAPYRYESDAAYRRRRKYREQNPIE